MEVGNLTSIGKTSRSQFSHSFPGHKRLFSRVSQSIHGHSHGADRAIGSSILHIGLFAPVTNLPCTEAFSGWEGADPRRPGYGRDRNQRGPRNADTERVFGIPMRIMHNVSIMNAVSAYGPQLYNFGQTSRTAGGRIAFITTFARTQSSECTSLCCST